MTRREGSKNADGRRVGPGAYGPTSVHRLPDGTKIVLTSSNAPTRREALTFADAHRLPDDVIARAYGPPLQNADTEHYF